MTSSGTGTGAARWTSALSALTTALMVLAAGMVLVGSVLPGGTAPKTPAYAALSPGAPVRLLVPALAVDARVVPIQVSADAVLDPPRDTQDVGWWDASAKPGSTNGQTVITGHTVHTGGGSMDRLRELHHGQKVDVVTRTGTMRYRVERVQVFSKEAIAQQAARLFGQRGGTGRLILISCTDWNGSYYESNVVVFGDPLGART